MTFHIFQIVLSVFDESQSSLSLQCRHRGNGKQENKEVRTLTLKMDLIFEGLQVMFIENECSLGSQGNLSAFYIFFFKISFEDLIGCAGP